MQNEVASRYGLALYQLAKEKNMISSWQEEVKGLISVIKENADFIVVLSSSFLSLEERNKILEDSLIGISTEIISLLKIVMENHRTSMMLDVLESFNSYCNEHNGVIEGYLYSSMRLDESRIKQIQDKIGKVENHKVELKNVIDPTLIGGIKIVIHDRIYDGSLKHYLENMKKDLLKKEGN